ncbi:hypothetical protein HB364_08950 [Pseudoflavitalea sp. X16]|uniref:hypothetical protein n=1 Tax=Paraflavitalea devenefica TaxID=2716334 RepID=UPI00141F8790|nr:hypothetical protein [Paraflavitalea devenefica]NII25206.1 hypothetical protein [Paraflavitalea devenefica]
MSLYTIDVKKYKAYFFQTLITNIVITTGTYILLKNGIYILSGFDPGKKLTSPILFAMIILAVVHGQHQKKQVKKLEGISNFEDRVTAYEKIYKSRLLWFFFACFISCFLAILTGRYLFFYYAIFDIVFSLLCYPNLLLFKRELKNEEIIFY